MDLFDIVLTTKSAIKQLEKIGSPYRTFKPEETIHTCIDENGIEREKNFILNLAHNSY